KGLLEEDGRIGRRVYVGANACVAGTCVHWSGCGYWLISRTRRERECGRHRTRQQPRTSSAIPYHKSCLVCCSPHYLVGPLSMSSVPLNQYCSTPLARPMPPTIELTAKYASTWFQLPL